MQSTIAVSLVRVFERVPDPRRRQGRRFSLAAILALCTAAMLANHRSVLAIAEWGADQTLQVRVALGFRDGKTPHQSTLSRVLARLDPQAVVTAITEALQAGTAEPSPRNPVGCAIDGKAQRTRQAYAAPPTGVVQMLNAVCHETGSILGQVPIEYHADKPEAELTVAPMLLAQLKLAGRVVTGDALFCQRSLCQQVRHAGGHYLFLVKANQPELLADLTWLFDPPTPGPALLDQRQAHTVDDGHQRLANTRHLIASTDLNGYLAWPGVAQVFRLERTWYSPKGWHRTIRYGITSLPPSVATAADLLALRRGHWQIENRLHYVCDQRLGEDACTLRVGSGPTMLSMLRATVISLLRRANVPSIAAALRRFSRRPHELIPFLNLEVPENA